MFKDFSVDIIVPNLYNALKWILLHLLLHVSLLKIVQVMIYDKNENIKKKYIVCRETRTHDLNLDSYALCPNG